jgi:hypothetical protein
MAKHTFLFRTYASDETENWNLPDALNGASAWGLYFFLEGEATHICSFTPSSRVEFLENVFLDPENEDAAEKLLENGDLQHETEQWTDYFGFIDVKSPRTRPYIGPREPFTLDTRDYDLDSELYAATLAKSRRFNVSEQQAHADAQRECLREFAYTAAREEFGCNSPAEPPVLMDSKVRAEHHRRAALRKAEAAERYNGPPALFSHAGIAAPLATRPADLAR